MPKHRFSRREFLKLSGLTGAAAALASCAPGTEEAATEVPEVIEGQPIELRLWHMETPPNRVEVFQGFIDEFNAAYPDINVTQETINWGEAFAKVTSAIQAGNQPDIQFTTGAHMHSVMPTGAVQPIDDIFAGIDSDVSFFDNQVSVFRYDGHTWAIPMFGLTHLLVYRTDLLGELGYPNGPETWDEWMEVAEALTGGDNYAITLPASKHLYTDQCITDIMAVNHSDIFAPDGTLIFNSPETVESFGYYRELYQYSPPDAPNMTWPEANASFLTGQSAMTPIFGAIFARLPNESPDFADEVASARIPIPPGGVHKSVGSANAAMILTDDAERQEASAEFLKFMTEPDRHAEWIANMQPGLYMPVSEEMAQSDSYWEQPILERYKQHILLAFEMSGETVVYGFNHDEPHPEVAAIDGENVLAQTVQKMVVDGMEPEEAVEWGHTKMEELIS
ncbi:MAG: extracellular solute-binding protein [Anaerolineales bacterium]|nr:extracellular solute-binding protein [Anaerolineales bacterium]